MAYTRPGAGLLAPGLTTGKAPFVEEARNRGELHITQAYELYSEENHESWRRLFARIRDGSDFRTGSFCAAWKCSNCPATACRAWTR